MGRTRANTMFSGEPDAPRERLCDSPGCAAPGAYRAPKSRAQLTEYYWFCLDHVRAYNQSWDWCAGLNEREMESAIRTDTTWQRPTWPLGGWRLWERRIRERAYHDPFFGFGGDGEGGRRNAEDSAAATPPPGTPEEEARHVLGLDATADFPQIKARWRLLVKLHHPDINGGDPGAEERLKRINHAYTTLKASLGR